MPYAGDAMVMQVFDGDVLRPDGPVDLEPGVRYRISVEPYHPEQEEAGIWNLLEELAGTLDAPADWSAEHDHYLYGSLKRSPDANP